MLFHIRITHNTTNIIISIISLLDNEESRVEKRRDAPSCGEGLGLGLGFRV